jgi:hypothetical protein
MADCSAAGATNDASSSIITAATTFLSPLLRDAGRMEAAASSSGKPFLVLYEGIRYTEQNGYREEVPTAQNFFTMRVLENEIYLMKNNKKYSTSLTRIE